MWFLRPTLTWLLVESSLCVVVDKSFVLHPSLRKHLAVWNEITKSWCFLGHKSFLLLDDGLFIAARNCLHAPGRTQITVWIIKIEPALPLVKYCSIAPKDLPMKTLSWSPTAATKCSYFTVSLWQAKIYHNSPILLKEQTLYFTTTPWVWTFDIIASVNESHLTVLS